MPRSLTVTDRAARLLDVAALLPEATGGRVRSLSVSSISEWRRCPERWRRRYLEGELEPASPAMVAGSAVGETEAASYLDQAKFGEPWPTDQALDHFATVFDHRAANEPVEWGDERPGEVKDRAAAALRAYHTQVPHTLRPAAVERKVEMRIGDLPWPVVGYLDLETADGRVHDLKLQRRKMTQQDADGSLQASCYLAARRAEGNPAPSFLFHSIVQTKQPQVELVETRRTIDRLNRFVELCVITAAQIVQACELDMWAPADPGSWVCSERYCGFWQACRRRL